MKPLRNNLPPNATLPEWESAQDAILLVFMPEVGYDMTLEALLEILVDSLRQQLGRTLHTLKINHRTHREVTRSFHITFIPTFVLIRGGVELWRHQGLLSEDTIIPIIRKLLGIDPP